MGEETAVLGEKSERVAESGGLGSEISSWDKGRLRRSVGGGVMTGDSALVCSETEPESDSPGGSMYIMGGIARGVSGTDVHIEESLLCRGVDTGGCSCGTTGSKSSIE